LKAARKKHYPVEKKTIQMMTDFFLLETRESGRKQCNIFQVLKRIFFFLWNWRLNSGFHNCKAVTLPLEPHLQSILLWLFWRWGFWNYLPGLALNRNPPDLSLPSSWCPAQNNPIINSF
jgi:hypothetical protein